MNWREIKQIAAQLRSKPTPSEIILWQHIRNRQLLGRKFLRQHPLIYDANNKRNELFFFIPDFYCSSEKLVLELDGPIHDFQIERDHMKDLILTQMNMRVLRIRNEELIDMESVKRKIIQIFF